MLIKRWFPSIEEFINNQVDRVTHSVEAQPLSPAILEQSGHGDGDEGYAWAQLHGLLTKFDLPMAATECQICQQQRNMLSLSYGTIPRVDQPVTCWQVDYIGPHSSVERTAMLLQPYCSSCLFWLWICFACSNASAICELTECLICFGWYSTPSTVF